MYTLSNYTVLRISCTYAQIQLLICTNHMCAALKCVAIHACCSYTFFLSTQKLVIIGIYITGNSKIGITGSNVVSSGNESNTGK